MKQETSLINLASAKEFLRVNDAGHDRKILKIIGEVELNLVALTGVEFRRNDLPESVGAWAMFQIYKKYDKNFKMIPYMDDLLTPWRKKMMKRAEAPN